jgi:hypothetical protein
MTNLATERRTLFFNFAHEPDHATATYHVVIAGRRYELQRLDGPASAAILGRERATNAFLRAVPDHALTHVVENAISLVDHVQLVHAVRGADFKTGTWSMSRVWFHLPAPAIAAAFERHAALFGPRPVSAKRHRYGLPPAATAQDLLEEAALIDSTDHATAMVGLHPEMLSIEPNSAAHIQHNLIQTNGTLQALASQLDAAGPATPQTTSGQPNASGWATLAPVLDDKGKPLKNGTGKHYKGLIHYSPEWHPHVLPFVSQVQRIVVKPVKNDVTLGSNVSAREPLLGKIWHRRDGVTHIDQSPGVRARAGAGMKYTMVNDNTEGGYRVTADVTQSGDQVTVTLNFENWYLRWLGLYAQFLDGVNVVPLAKVSGISKNTALDTTKNEVFLGIITPEFTIYGVPLQESKKQVTFTFPTKVATNAKILASGAGFGPATFPETEQVGLSMTFVFNLVIPTLLLGMGATQGIDAFTKGVIVPLANVLAVELVAAKIGADWKQALTIFWRALVRWLASPGSVKEFAKLFPPLMAYISGEEAADAVEDALPLVGEIIQAVAALGTAAEILETSCEIALSPRTYENDLSLTHDLHVTINAQPGSLRDADQYTVTAQFDNGGTPVTQTVPMRNGADSIPVTFTNVPLGGQVNISASFYKVAAGPNHEHVLLGKGTTGLVSNAVDTLAPIALTPIRFPLGPNTVYKHRQVTALDAQSNHVWQDASAPPKSAPGALSELYGITVRQKTASPGYVGYSWQGQDRSGNTELQDRMANLNTDTNAQQGYLKAPFGLPPSRSRTWLAYSLLGQDSANFYLDTTTGLIRRVTLGLNPSFDSPTSNQAWGKLNFPSDQLLLHPTGKLVSLNMQLSKLETQRLPPQAVSDDYARIHLQAQAHSGPGTRPGLMASPCAVTITPTGVVVVLEQETNRLQALDTSANPVPYFTKQPKSHYYLPLATTDPDTVYLDLASEFKGFLYVLSQLGNEYRLDVYHPEQADSTPICTTRGVTAAKLTVDLWRSVYTLNFEQVLLPGNTLPPFTEPSVSLWLPDLKTA